MCMNPRSSRINGFWAVVMADDTVRDDFFFSRERLPRTKASLERDMKTIVDWGRHNSVPLYIGEFGSSRPSFKDKQDGLRWVEDMLDIMKANGLHFTYHSYSGESFGIYPEDGVLPDPSHANKPLVELFTAKLRK